ncbi:MAG: Rha family transcriptional regulator [Candidatus Kariarchaeaceae archaeon]
MTKQLVYTKRNKNFTTTRIIAKKFGKKHAYVVRALEKVIKDFSNLRVIANHPYFKKRIGEYRGVEFEYYELDRELFSLLVMRFKGKKAFEWQVKFNQAFYQMEETLIKMKNNQQNEMWLCQREQSKLIRHEETDVIKQFVEYATKQGSTKANFYYKHITNATYKCLGLIQYKRPKLRETLDVMETHQLILAEMTAKKSLLKYMENGENYKAIFVLVKQDLENFANSFLMRIEK